MTFILSVGEPCSGRDFKVNFDGLLTSSGHLWQQHLPEILTFVHLHETVEVNTLFGLKDKYTLTHLYLAQPTTITLQ